MSTRTELAMALTLRILELQGQLAQAEAELDLLIEPKPKAGHALPVQFAASEPRASREPADPSTETKR